MSEVKILQLVPTPDVALWSVLAATTVSNGASKIGVQDSADYYAGDDVEEVLQEIGLERNIRKVHSTTVNYTIQALDEIIVANGTNLVITLPSATGSGRTYTVKNINTSALTLTPYGTNTIDGETTQTIYEYEDLIICDALAGSWIKL